MNWKIPPVNVFFVPWPYNAGDELFKLVAHRTEPGAPVQYCHLVNKETGETASFPIADYYGPYPADQLPDLFAQLATDNIKVTGAHLSALLKKKLPEFATAKQIMFYKLYKPATNDSKK